MSPVVRLTLRYKKLLFYYRSGNILNMTQPDNTPERAGDLLTEQLRGAQALQVAGRWQESADAYTQLEQLLGADTRIFNGRGVAWRMLRNPAAAIFDFTLARDLAKAQGNQEEQLTAEVGLIDAWRVANRDPNFNPWTDVQPENLQARFYQEAQAHMTAAQFLMDKMPKPSLAKVNAFTNFGLLHENMGNFPQSLEAYNQAKSIIRALAKADPQNIDFQNRLARTLTVKGVTQERLGLLKDAVASQEKSLNIYESLGDLRGLGNVRVSLGDVLRKLNKPQEARNYYEQAQQGATGEGSIADPEIYDLAVQRLSQLQTPPTQG